MPGSLMLAMGIETKPARCHSLPMVPMRYLYLVNVVTNEPLVIFPVDHLNREGEVIVYEAQLRAQHNLDDSESGVMLRDSLFDPLPPASLEAFATAPLRAFQRAMQKRTRH